MSPQLRLNEANLPEYLGKIGIFPQGEELSVEAVGDGNINWVRRVTGASGSRVVKQARPALERFPEYRASTERIAIEARFYETVARFDRDRICPEVVFFDPEQCVLVLEDLGEVERLDAALARDADLARPAERLARFLGRLHAGTADQPALAARFENDDMRRLHGEHIFHLPYRPNDFVLSEAVARVARSLQADATLVRSIDAAYERYLEPRGALVHGDVQAANVLLPPSGPKLLDAEIAHIGDPAFDLGQLLAHLMLPSVARGRPEGAGPAVRAACRTYLDVSGADAAVLGEAARYAGVELLRRTMGAARVPAVASDAAALAVLDEGRRLVGEARLPPALGF
ncbi:MAG: phosphotransferase [Myxococcota bacterium]|nr:phosphotransferase [Myxococcota bacterium]